MLWRRIGLVASLCTVVGGVVTIAFAQIQIESDTVHVKIVNEMGYAIRLKVVGYQSDAYLSASLNDHDNVVRDFYSGERVVCVWDESKRVKMAAIVKFDRNGTLRLHPPEQNQVFTRSIEAGD